MQEKTIFVAEDGTRFDNQEDCLEWDEIFERVKELKEWGGEKEKLPEGLQEEKEIVGDFLDDLDNSETFFGCYIEANQELDRYRAWNYLSNYVFYGSANPCKP